MNISFDFEEKLTPEQIAELYTGQTGIILTQTKELIEQRLSVLKDEIEWQGGYIVISLNPKLQVQYHNVTKDLGSKMIACIDQRDHDYIMNRVWKALYPDTTPPTS